MLVRAVFPGVSIAAVVALVLLIGCSGKSEAPAAGPSGPAGTVVTSTTKIASAGVLGNQRRPDESCAPDPARLDPPPPGPLGPKPLGHAAGETAVVPDPQRIVVLAGDELDALCALGLQSRIVAAALPDGPGPDGATTQPSYLGTVVHDAAPAGTRSAVDLAAVAAAKPDLILGSQETQQKDYPALAAIAPTVLTATTGPAWQDNLRLVGAATGRFGAAEELIAGFTAAAREKGAANDAAHFQASIVQLTDTTLRVWGAQNFPASVLAAVGVDRPAAQRFTDKPYIEIGLDGTPDFSPADADIVYMSFASPAAKERAPQVLDSDAWRTLSANRDNRVFVVNNEVWQTGQGLVAARGILDDLSWLNAPIN